MFGNAEVTGELMSVSSITFAAPTARIRSATNPAIAIARSSKRSTSSSESLSVTELRQQHRAITKLRSLLPELSQEIRASFAGSTAGVNVKSIQSHALAGVPTSATPATLESTDQINTTSTAFSPTNPEFSGISTAQPNIGGTYNGATSDVFTFTATRSGFVGGLTSLRFDVTNQNDEVVDTASFGSFTPAGTEYSLNSGLTFSLSSGYVALGDSFEVTVEAGLDNKADPTKAFNGTGTESANLQPGSSVSNGSFTINGAEINVLASDNINSVLGKINAANIGVTATFDIARERVVLTANHPGADGDIVLGSDSSGFLNAMRLAGAVLTPGIDGGTARRLSDVSAFTGASTGNFLINDKSISVDVDVDSLNSLIAKVNSAEAGVSASYQTGTSRFRLRSNGGSKSVDLQDGSSAWFTAIGIDTGVHKLSQRKDGPAYQRDDTIRSLKSFANAINSTAKSLEGSAVDFRDAVHRAFYLNSDNDSATGDTQLHEELRMLGFEFDDKNQTLGLNNGRLESRLLTSRVGSRDLLVGAADDSEGAVIGRLDSALDNLQKRLKYQAVAMGGYIA